MSDVNELTKLLFEQRQKAHRLLGNRYDELTKEPRRVITELMKRDKTDNPLEVLPAAIDLVTEQINNRKKENRLPDSMKCRAWLWAVPGIAEQYHRNALTVAIASITAASTDIIIEMMERDELREAIGEPRRRLRPTRPDDD